MVCHCYVIWLLSYVITWSEHSFILESLVIDALRSIRWTRRQSCSQTATRLWKSCCAAVCSSLHQGQSPVSVASCLAYCRMHCLAVYRPPTRPNSCLQRYTEYTPCTAAIASATVHTSWTDGSCPLFGATIADPSHVTLGDVVESLVH